MTNLIKPQEVVNSGIYRGAPLNARFDINLIAPHIQIAEERFIVTYLGQDLYDAMVTAQNPAVSNYNPDFGALVNKFPNNANYETLWTKYLLLLESQVVYYEALPFIGIQVGSAGVFLNNSEFATNAGVDPIKFLQDTTMQRIENLQELLRTYLCDNQSTYPLFDNKDCPCEDGGCNDGCSDCHCGYWQKYGTYCPHCKTGKDNSTGIIFY